MSRALLVVLDRLSPRQRVAYVLHDLFAVPFERIAAVLDTSPDAAKKLAGRARTALHAAEPNRPEGSAEHFALIHFRFTGRSIIAIDIAPYPENAAIRIEA